MNDRYVHHPARLTREQEQNFLTLARHLVLTSQQTDWDASNFRMGTVARSLLTGEDLTPEEVVGRDGLIVADALAFGPLAGIAPLSGEDWQTYQERTLGAAVDSPLEWWLFSSWWLKTDNTPIGAAMRMMYTLDYGVPHDYRLISEGRAKSDYLDNSFLWERLGMVRPGAR